MSNQFVDKLLNFHPLDERDVAALVSATSTGRKIAARKDIIREGDRPGLVFVVLDGWACRYKILPSGT